MDNDKLKVFLNSAFFVLGFVVVFSLLGVLLQTVLSTVAFSVQSWLARIGGIIIILFGLYLLGLIRIPFLEREHKFSVRKTRYTYLTSALFGVAFAVGWTPCVGAVLGVILTLAVAHPGSAFFLLLSYSLGLGIPFLLIGLFTAQATALISRFSRFLKYFNIVVGLLLLALGVLVFTNQLARVANFEAAVNLFGSDLGLEQGGAASTIFTSGLSLATLGIAFFFGMVSFLSPCVLPLVPAMLAYLSGTSLAKSP
ncbi:cytochrome C biogenesis protein [Candidatus Woesearchaeota archaeon]|nr:cytochrome C biogenesis protein [Candidatus Woesearchaeota archaeon]